VRDSSGARCLILCLSDPIGITTLAGGVHLFEGKANLWLRVQKFREVVGEVNAIFSFNLEN
jgi:hypothetical protein